MGQSVPEQAPMPAAQGKMEAAPEANQQQAAPESAGKQSARGRAGLEGRMGFSPFGPNGSATKRRVPIIAKGATRRVGRGRMGTSRALEAAPPKAKRSSPPR